MLYQSLSQLFFVTTAVAQTTQCVWNSIDDWDHLNGEYVEQGTWETGDGKYPYYKRSSTSCTNTEQYIFGAWHAPDDMNYWAIHPSLEANSPDGTPDCGLDEKKFPNDPSQCESGWQMWYDEKDYVELPLTVTTDNCPALECIAIGMSNSGNTLCDRIFSRDASKSNVFVYHGQSVETYLFFNQYTFRWHCSDTLDDTYCGDDQNMNDILQSSKDGWTDVAVGRSFDQKMSNGWTATLECMDSTDAPTASTKSPTVSPTPEPTPAPTPGPTVDPTSSPTPAPTAAPTKNPTKNPTTPSPTPPGTLECGEQDTGAYNGETVTFMVNAPFRCDIIFDARYSGFQINVIEAWTELDEHIITDYDSQGILMLSELPPGNYKFSIYGGYVTGVQYDVRTICTSKSPTSAPTNDPTPAPTMAPTLTPTPAPTVSPTANPTSAPSLVPTFAPTVTTFSYSPSMIPTMPPTTYVTVNVEDDDDDMDRDDTLIDTKGETMLKTAIYVMIGMVAFCCVCVCMLLGVYFYRLQNKKKQKEGIAKQHMSEYTTDANTDTNVIKGEVQMPLPVFYGNKQKNKNKNKNKNRNKEQQNDDIFANNINKMMQIERVWSVEDDVIPQDMDISNSSSSLFGSVSKHGPNATVNVDNMDVNVMPDEDGYGDIDVPVPGEGILGECADCGEHKMGRLYDGDGLFYCEQCWQDYEEVGNRQQEAINTVIDPGH